MSHSREISSNPSVFKEKIEKGATSKFSLFNRIFFSRFSWNDKLSFTMFLWLQRKNNQDRFLCRLAWNNVLLFTCEKCTNPTVDRLCMTNSWLSKTCGRRGGKQVERGDWETGNQSRWWGGLRAYSSQNKRRKRESDNKKSERLGQIGAYSSPEKGIVIEGLVPMAIAPSMNVFVGICVCVCGWTVTGPWDHKERLAKAVVNHIDAMGLETAEILG